MASRQRLDVQWLAAWPDRHTYRTLFSNVDSRLRERNDVQPQTVMVSPT